MLKYIKESILVSLIIILVILSIGFSASKEYRKALKDKTAFKLGALRGSLNKLQDDFKDKEKLKKQFEKRLDELSRKSASLETQITQIKEMCDESEKQLIMTERNISASYTKIKNLLTDKKKRMDRILSSKPEVSRLESHLASLKRATSALERHLKKMIRINKTKKEAPQQDISAGAPPVLYGKTTSLEGEVLLVNSEFNFMVINLGKRNGLKENDRLYICDDEKPLVEVFVEEVRESISAIWSGKDLDAYRIKPGAKFYFTKL